MSATAVTPKVVSHSEWLAARKQFLKKEKEFTRLRDELSRERRELPRERVEKQYVFDGPKGKVSLADLFGSRTQLIVYHFMFGPDWEEGCPSCSFGMDHTDGALPHLANRDVAFAAVSRAPIAKIETFKKRMGWHFNWVSSYNNDFNYDFGVSFTKEELARDDIYNFGTSGHPSEEAPGFSVFEKTEAEILRTYSTFGRGVEVGIHTYALLDLVPKGRDEDGLYFPMAWVRHHDRYEDGRLADATKPYWPSEEEVTTGKTGKATSCCAEHA
jgi:predicted dithiol-disulfide oxidoreductase (DUF899 family)